MANKNFWSGMLIMALILGTAIIGCENGTNNSMNNSTNNGSAGGSNDITYTVTANGKADEETSTQLEFTFSADVSGLQVGDFDIFDITGTAKINTSKPIKDIVTGDGTSWKLSITKITAGKIRVQIDKKGIERSRKTLIVHQNTASASTKGEAIELPPDGEWAEGTFEEKGEEKWYKFVAKAGTDYYVQWSENAKYGYTAWTNVAAYQSDDTPIFPATTYGPKLVSGVSGTVYLKVTPYRGLGGTYAIRFYDSANMPQVIIKVDPTARATFIPFVAIKWFVQPQSTEISESEVTGFRVYRSNTKTGKYTQIGEDFITDFKLTSYAFYDTDKIIYYDRDVTAGNTYWYKIAAYNNSKGMEGDMSDPIQSEVVPGPTEPLPLTIGEKIDSAIDTELQVVWYKFEADSAKTYRVQWESFSENLLGYWVGDYASITVSAFTNDRELIDFTEKYSSGYYSGWSDPGTVSGVNGTVYLKVEAGTRTGPYNIKVYE